MNSDMSFEPAVKKKRSSHTVFRCVMTVALSLSERLYSVLTFMSAALGYRPLHPTDIRLQ